jgi:predicted dehydrogenase
MTKLKVAVVGLGIGTHHLRAYEALPERFEVVALCDLDEQKLAEAAAQHGATPYTDFDALLQESDAEVIDLCTPPHLHYPQTRRVLEGGRTAICEKPLVGSLAEVDALAALERQTGQRVMPIFQYRFGHGLQKLKFLSDQGVVGRALTATVETSWRRRAAYYDVPWRGKWATELGGALISHAIHAHDMLSYILGPVRRVAAFTATRVNPIEVEDCASIALEFADGSLASLSVTLGSAAEITHHRFCFQNLVAESNLAPYNNSAEPWTFTPDTPEQGERLAAALGAFVPPPEGYAGQFSRLYDALTQGGPLPVALSDARASLELVSAIYEAAEHGSVVELPLTEGHPRYASWVPEAYRQVAS